MTDFRVPPLRRKQIRAVAQQIRQDLGVTAGYFPIVQFLEVYGAIDPEYFYDIRSKAEMGEEHGLTYPDKKVMLIREDVYDNASAGQGRDRATIAHEFGHLFLHQGLGMARVMAVAVEPYRSAEWQAKCFAGELLVDHRCIKKMSKRTVAHAFGVSTQAAEMQLRAFKREGLI